MWKGLTFVILISLYYTGHCKKKSKGPIFKEKELKFQYISPATTNALTKKSI